MQNFSLIRKLNSKPDDNVSKLAEGIEYQQYELIVDAHPRIVNIPLSTVNAFEEELTEHDDLNRKTLKFLLRKHRGIRG